MVKIYFYGGEDIKKRNCYEISKKIFSQFHKPRVLVIPWTTSNREKELKYRRILQEYFRDLGAGQVSFLERGLPAGKLRECFRNADILYLPGGETGLLLKSIKKEGIEKLIKEFPGVIVGNSAGALVLGKYCVTKEEGHIPSLKKGLSLVNFSVYIHYNPDKDFKTVKKLARKGAIFALPEKAVLEFDKKTRRIKTFGDIYFFH